MRHEEATDYPAQSETDALIEAREMAIRKEDEERNEAIIAEQKRGTMQGFRALQRDLVASMHAHGVENVVVPPHSPLIRMRESA